MANFVNVNCNCPHGCLQVVPRNRRGSRSLMILMISLHEVVPTAAPCPVLYICNTPFCWWWQFSVANLFLLLKCLPTRKVILCFCVKSVDWFQLVAKKRLKSLYPHSSHTNTLQEIGSFSMREWGSEGKLFPRLEGWFGFSYLALWSFRFPVPALLPISWIMLLLFRGRVI